MNKDELPVLEIDGLEHHLRNANSDDEFIVTVDRPLKFYPGHFTSILGPSGCGKTTLLTILGLLRRPVCDKPLGRFFMHVEKAPGQFTHFDVAALWQNRQEKTLESLRRQYIGFALQSGDLLPFLNVRENIALPLQLNGFSSDKIGDRVDHLVRAFGLEKRQSNKSPDSRLAYARVNRLSGGEYQRVVLARSIAHFPRIVFVDEPTSALNRELARNALTQLKLSQDENEFPASVIMITHDEELAKEFSDSIIRMEPESERAAGRLAH